MGALLALLLTGTEFSIIALIGVILLIGIVKKNAIMMIDFALEAAEREQGLSTREAIFQACLLRFRPIMMTTFAALLGAMPLALDTGTGAELRRPAGHRHRRRPDREPGADTLYHAGRVSVSRSASACGRAAWMAADVFRGHMFLRQPAE